MCCLSMITKLGYLTGIYCEPDRMTVLENVPCFYILQYEQ